MMLGIKNNRQFQPRAPVQLTARLRGSDYETQAEVLSISEGGCFLKLNTAPMKGSRLKLFFDLPNQGPHFVEVEVRYSTQKGEFRGRRDVTGAGCQFIGLPATTQQVIRDLVNDVKKNYSQIQFALALSKPNPELPRMLERAHLREFGVGRELREAVRWGLKQMGT
jgi:hypothetical protein